MLAELLLPIVVEDAARVVEHPLVAVLREGLGAYLQEADEHFFDFGLDRRDAVLVARYVKIFFRTESLPRYGAVEWARVSLDSPQRVRFMRSTIRFWEWTGYVAILFDSMENYDRNT